MNKIFLIGKIIGDIEFKFMIDSNDISVVGFEIFTTDKQKIQIKGYNEVADFVYRNIARGDSIVIQGKLRNQYVEIEEINAINKKD